MPQTNRPLQRLRTAEIERLFTWHQSNQLALEIMLGELARRATPQAHQLGERVRTAYEQRLQSRATSIEPTRQVVSDQSGPWADSPDIGFLKKMGYAVGRSGEPVIKRRRILDEVFLKRVPSTFDALYRTKWGLPGTGERLQKMAYAIATFARGEKQKNRRVDMDEAIIDREVDLAYLKATYYDGRYTFAWPTTQVS